MTWPPTGSPSPERLEFLNRIAREGIGPNADIRGMRFRDDPAHVPKNRRFPQAVGLKEGHANPDVSDLQRYLARFGYLNPTHHGLQEVDPEFDSATVKALRDYQRFHRLRVTGKLNAATVDMMSRPRCGVPDILPGGQGWATQGSVWTTTSLTYAFFNHPTSGLTTLEAETAVADGLQLWADHSPLTFTPVALATAHHLEAKWVTGDHGDGAGNAFDGAGGTGAIAHCNYPPPGGGTIYVTAGRAHFDDDEPWNIDGSQYDLMATAAHEFGHGIGLDHTMEQEAVMWQVMLGPHADLHADDIASVQYAYPGQVEPPPDPGGTLPAVPTGVSATALNSTSIRIAWSAASGATSYTILVSDSGAGPFASMVTGITGLSYDAGGLPADTTKYYVVRSVNASGSSANSSVVNATTTSGAGGSGTALTNLLIMLDALGQIDDNTTA